MCNNAIKSITLAMLMLGAVGALAAPITGNVVWADYFAQSVKSTDLRFGNSQSYSDLEVLLICVDVTTHVPEDGEVAFDANSGAVALKGGSGAKGVAAIHWLFDQYYQSVFLNGGAQGQWAFQFILWEVGNDFDGSVGSVDAYSGFSNILEEGYFPGDPLFFGPAEMMYAGLIDALPTLSAAYRSKKYTLDLLKNHDPEYQNMVAFINRAPMPSTATARPVPVLGGLLAIWLSIGLTFVSVAGLRGRDV